MKRNKSQIVAELETEGLRFKHFTLTHEGDYAPEDADWNYKDVPHLHHVHDLVEAMISSVSDDHIATINMQQVLGMKTPLAVFNYQVTPGSQIYYATWFFFVLIVETVYREVSPGRTRVDTTYSVGSSPWLAWCFPVIRWLISRNYENLMSTDVPMRLRRGQLRKWGYGFRNEGSTYSFERTMDIASANVVPPKDAVPFGPVTFSVDKDLPEGSEKFLGRDDHLGLRIARADGKVSIFPRLCPHEGASLDERPCSNDRVICRWHGRAFRPLGSIDVSQGAPATLRTAGHEFVFKDALLTITPIKDHIAP